MDKVVITLKLTKPNFVSSYKFAKRLVDPATTHTQLKGKITDIEDGLLLKTAIVSVSCGIPAPKKSIRFGNYQFKPLRTLGLRGYG